DVYFAVATPLFGGSPVWFHVANIVVHAANAVMLWLLAATMSADATYAFLGALFFAVQPADVDAVAWVSALAEPVSAGLGCAATLCFLRYRRSGSFWQYGVSIGSFVLALLTHESAVVFAALIPLADWADERQGSRAAMPYAGYGIALALYLAV